MTSSATPWFYHRALSQQFEQSLQAARQSGVISDAQQLWLQRLVDEQDSAVHDALQVRPRVDRLLVGQAVNLPEELATAWMISDPADTAAPVFLHTLLNGLECFADRPALSQAITLRFARAFQPALAIEAEQVEGNPFIKRMQRIVQRQVAHLDAVSTQLDGLPTLHAMLGKNLLPSLPERNIDVFTHLLQLQINDPQGQTLTIGTQTLADAALQQFGKQHNGTGEPPRQVFLDAAGTALDEAQGKPWAAALASAGQGLAACYAAALSDYWQTLRSDGRSVREFAAAALAESFREQLLRERMARTFTAYQVQQLSGVLRASLIDPAVCRVWQPSLLLNGPAAPKLVGVFVLEFSDTQLPGLYLFSATDGLQHFADRQQLEKHFRHPDNLAQRLRLTSLDEHQALRELQVQRVRLDAIDQPLFARMLDSIIALQKRNLDHVLTLAPIHPQRMAVRIDDALDIRPMLEPRLEALHDNWRWSSAAEDFARRWVAQQTVSEFTAEQLERVMYSPANTWFGQLSTLDQLLSRHCDFYERSAGCLRDTLNRYLAVQGGAGLDARELWVHSGASNTRLIALALARISGHTRGALPADAQLIKGDSEELPATTALPVDLLDWVLGQVEQEFAARYRQHLQHFFSRPLRWLDTQVRPQLIQGLIFEAAVYLDLSMSGQRQPQQSAGLLMLQQVMDRPLRSLRAALGEQRVEVHRLQLLYDPQQPALAVDNTMVLTQASAPGQHVLWSFYSGISTHASVADLERHISGRIASAQARTQWMSLLPGADRARLQAHLDKLQEAVHLQVRLTRLDGNALQALQSTAVARRCTEVSQAFERARPWALSADTLRHVLGQSECNDPLRGLLDRLGVNMEIQLADALLPQWMKDASIWHLFTLSAFIERWYIACSSGHDYLYGIAEPLEYARDKLRTRLAADYPGQTLDPDRISVTLTRYTPAPVALGEIPQAIPAATRRESTSLSEFVIGRFGAIQDGTLSAAIDDDASSQVTLSGDYLRTLVRDLDIGKNYRMLLEDSFTAGRPGHATRLEYYTEQVPPLELMRTYAMFMRKELSAEGFRFIEAILTMPEAQLRLPVLERSIVISPLLLRAAADMVADRVPGAFIIAPQPPQPGPWLLYTLFNADFHVQEYTDQAALLHDVHNDTALQQFILDRLPEASRRLYANGGFLEPHIPFSTESDLDVPWQTPKPVTLAMAPITGNALHALFDSTAEILQWWFARLSVSNAQSDRAATTFLWKLGAEQVLALVPGRLGALVGLWQGQSLLHDSAADVLQMQWGKAAAELLAALGVLLTTRRGRDKELTVDEESDRVPEQGTRTQNPTFGWGNNSLTPELWSRLRAYQVQNLDLAALHKDPLVNTYEDQARQRTYVSITGAMYRIEKDEYGWFIVGEPGQGPRIAMREGQWQLNLQRGLHGGGGILTRLKSGLISAEVDQVLIVEAHGMSEIRRKFRTRAEDIAQAHAQAREYLENSLDNLDHRMPDGQHHMRVTSILKEFFDIQAPPASLFEEVRKQIARLYSALMDSSLSPLDSQRYVVGVRRSSLDEVTAFSFPAEPARRLYLTERFFRDPTFRLKPHVLSHSRFNQGLHHRATVLIHELTHLYCGTEDMAYIDAHVPFVDLLEEHSDYRRMVKNEVIARQRGLSWRTPRSELFRLQRDDGNWYDLVDKNAKSKIRQITGKHKLEDARDVFYSDDTLRSQVIMANADSLALLVTLLGRERLVP